MLSRAKQALRSHGNPEKAAILLRFFKTGPGEYGEGDRFLGVVVPKIRAVARTFAELSLADCAALLASPVHEDRMLAAIVLANKSQRASKAGDHGALQAAFACYLENRCGINNWDLVDVSAPHVVGAYLWDKERTLLHELAASARMWDRRAAILATFHFICRGDFRDTLALCEELLGDREDLMHKATGWMLREVGGRGGVAELRAFLETHGRRMPRTMLRYAIEKLPSEERARWLSSTKEQRSATSRRAHRP